MSYWRTATSSLVNSSVIFTSRGKKNLFVPGIFWHNKYFFSFGNNNYKTKVTFALCCVSLADSLLNGTLNILNISLLAS